MLPSGSALRTYHLGYSQVDWDTAQAYCSKNYTGMATVVTTEDAVEIVKIAKNTNSSVWLGMKTDADGNVFCLNGDSLTPWMMPSGTPNNAQCVFVKPEKATWELGGCMDAHYPLCYTGESFFCFLCQFLGRGCKAFFSY